MAFEGSTFLKFFFQVLMALSKSFELIVIAGAMASLPFIMDEFVLRLDIALHATFSLCFLFNAAYLCYQFCTLNYEGELRGKRKRILRKISYGACCSICMNMTVNAILIPALIDAGENVQIDQRALSIYIGMSIALYSVRIIAFLRCDKIFPGISRAKPRPSKASESPSKRAEETGQLQEDSKEQDAANKESSSVESESDQAPKDQINEGASTSPAKEAEEPTQKKPRVGKFVRGPTVPLHSENIELEGLGGRLVEIQSSLERKLKTVLGASPLEGPIKSGPAGKETSTQTRTTTEDKTSGCTMQGSGQKLTDGDVSITSNTSSQTSKNAIADKDLKSSKSIQKSDCEVEDDLIDDESIKVFMRLWNTLSSKQI